MKEKTIKKLEEIPKRKPRKSNQKGKINKSRFEKPK